MSWWQTRRRAPGRSAIYVVFTWTFLRALTYGFFRLVYRTRYTGRENVPREGAVLFVANHQSHYDPPLIGALVGDRPLTFVARSGLFNFKPFAWFITFLGAMPIRQGESDLSAMKRTLAELEAGRCVLVFPEGSRTPDGSVHPFQRGISLLLKRTKATIVPVAVEGVYDVWPTGRSFPRLRGRLAAMAGQPIEHGDLMAEGVDKAVERLRHEIDTMRMELRKDLRARTGGRLPAPSAGDRLFGEQTGEPHHPDGEQAA